MSRPNLKINFNGIEYFGGAIVFHGENRTLSLHDPVMGVTDIGPNTLLPCEWVDLDIPTAMRDAAPNGGKVTGTINDVFNMFNADYEAMRDSIVGG
jgi:hypothetical protein